MKILFINILPLLKSLAIDNKTIYIIHITKKLYIIENSPVLLGFAFIISYTC